MTLLSPLPVALAILAFASPSASLAETYPSKPIKWIVPFSPGGPTDSFSRPVAKKLSELLGQPVVVENIPGAGASIGMDRLAKSAPDGYSIGLATTGTHCINPHLYGARLPHDTLKHFTPVALLVKYTNVLIVNPTVPAKNVGELVAYAKANPNKVNFGSAGNGSSNHLSGELLRYVTGAPMSHVPYKGSAPALTDVIAGNLTFMFDQLVTVLPQVKAGKVRALAVTSEARSPHAPDIPTIAESGVKGFAEAGSDLWLGIVGPAGMPKAIVDELNAKLIEAMNTPEIRQRVTAQAFDLWTSTPEEFAKVIRSGHDKWGKIVKATGAKVD
jgi:tripartite-type tricarboxylate transporter receptor subunit TctC